MTTTQKEFYFSSPRKEDPFLQPFPRSGYRSSANSCPPSHHRPGYLNHRKNTRKTLFASTTKYSLECQLTHCKGPRYCLTNRPVCFFNYFMVLGKTQVQPKIFLFKAVFKVIFITFPPSGSRASITGKSDRKE